MLTERRGTTGGRGILAGGWLRTREKYYMANMVVMYICITRDGNVECCPKKITTSENSLGHLLETISFFHV
jgi:hypothetical protein